MKQKNTDVQTRISFLQAKIYQLEIEREIILKQLVELEQKVEHCSEKKWELGYQKNRLQTMLNRINQGTFQYRDFELEPLEYSYYDACELEKGVQRTLDFYLDPVYDFSMKEIVLSKRIENANEELVILQGKESSSEMIFSKRKKAFSSKNNSTKKNI